MSRKLLLASAALSSLAATQACGKKEAPLPGNPKGSMYDQRPDAAAQEMNMPGNPKGSHYDTTSEDMKPAVPTTMDAGGSKADAATTATATTGPKADAAAAKPLKK
jgi:hypothetical protein